MGTRTNPKTFYNLTRPPNRTNIEWDPLTSAQAAYYSAYGQYLNAVDERNRELKKQLTEYYEKFVRRYHWAKYFGSPEARKEGQKKINEQINQEYNASKERKMGYKEWMINKQSGWQEQESIITPTTIELQGLQEVNENMNKFITGMQKGWEVANQLYLPQAATLSALSQMGMFHYPNKKRGESYTEFAKRKDDWYQARTITCRS